MLNPEAAKKRLEQWSAGDDASEERFLPAVKKLPAKLRTIAYSLLNRDAKGNDEFEDWQVQQEYQRGQLRALDGLTRSDRIKLYGVFFGSLAADIETGRQWMKSLPLSVGYAHKPFRAPQSPELTRERRGAWVQSLITLAAAFQSGVLSPAWLAAWVPHVTVGGWHTFHGEVGTLLAAVIDSGGKAADEVFDILCASARKEHDIGGMGQHVTQGLLCSSRVEGWELMEKMLLAAQRQEGLRQSILEPAVDAHPQAFRRLLRLIVDKGLCRFSSVVRAMDVWFGMGWAAAATKRVNDTIAAGSELLEKPAERKKVLSGSDAERAYLALWAIAFDDAPASVKPAEILLRHKDVEMRYVAALHLSRLGIPQTQPARVKALDDDDLRVALTALAGGMQGEFDEPDDIPGSEPLFNALERLYERMPEKPKTLQPLVWPWTEINVARDYVSSLLVTSLGTLPPTRLIPHLKRLDPWARANVVNSLANQKKWDAQTREAIFERVGDASANVRESAIDALAKNKIKPAEAEQLEGYLTRTTADLRNGVVSLILTLSDKDAIGSASRLLESKNKNQRLAGLELLRRLSEANRQRSKCIELAQSWADGRKTLLKDEQSQLDAILDSDREVLTLDNALGLMDPAERTQVTPPKKHKVQCVTPAVPKLLKSLDDLVHEHRQVKVRYRPWSGSDEEESLLGEITYGFPTPSYDKPVKEQLALLPLHDVWEEWFRKRPAALKDKDGLELLRAWSLYRIVNDWSFEDAHKWLRGSRDRKPLADHLLGAAKIPSLKYDSIVGDLLQWLLVLHPPKNAVDFCLDVIESIQALIPAKDMEAIRYKPGSKVGDPFDFDAEEHDWRNFDFVSEWESNLPILKAVAAERFTRRQRKRHWQILSRLDEPFPGAERNRPRIAELAEAYCAGDATLADVADHLLGPREPREIGTDYHSLRSLTSRPSQKPFRAFLERPEIADLIGRIQNRLLEIELARGETWTWATAAALWVASYRGLDTLMKLLKALGKDGFKKLSGWGANAAGSRPATFTALVEKVWPADDDTPQRFATEMKQAVKDGHFPEERLLQLAFLAPQWTDHVEAALNWDGFTEGLYWYMAHMKYVMGVTDALESDADAEEPEAADDDDDAESADKPKKLSRWDRIIRERTPLTDAERGDGAIDVDWFHRTYKQLTPKRWEALSAAAKFAATTGQAKRAQFIADVLLGKASKKDLVDGIKKRNLKENVRLLGLLPLAGGAKRDKDVVERYEVLQHYRRYANKLSSMTKPEALRAVEIGMRNLAATAGYADPMRLQWAMEAESTKDLASGSLQVAKGDTSLTLSLNERAEPELVVRRGDKVLKSLPKTVNKDAKFVELRERSTHLKRQAARVKQSLEVAMCRGDEFTARELQQLADHAILWPQLSRLVLVGEGCIGYPVKGGKAVQDHAGRLEPVKKNERFRIAHPHDLLQTQAWDRWQHECFHVERLQPFKQVFRELYVVTAQEKKDDTFSNRYAGQQVQPRQAYALWGSRGWSADEYEGVWKTFHEEQLVAGVSFNRGYTTPLEVEGLTLDRIEFRRREEYTPLKLTDVSPRTFSEAMRDLDLVVSVAHAGDVDPEASASTVEMRTALLRETCDLLNLKNVSLRDSRAIIKGGLGEYTVHLGSGVVHRMPGGSVCIVPVHAQHRGRLFLPFADDDPRTAEVISKTLLLSRDEEIDDPIILDQLRLLAS
jgi:HEAT repeat protein